MTTEELSPYIVITEFPEGHQPATADYPVNQLEDAKTLAQDYVIKTSVTRAAVTLRETGEVIVAYVAEEVDE